METILVLTSYDHVFNHAVTRLLDDHPSVEVIQRNLSDGPSLKKITRDLAPSKMIVNKKLFLENAWGIIESMTVAQEMKLIILNEYENNFQVVSQKTVAIQSGQDFVREVAEAKNFLEMQT